MIKRIITALSLIGATFSSYAEANYMTVEKTDGTLISFKLADNPVITYEGGNLEINKDEKTTYSFDDIKNYHFTSNDESAVSTFSANVLKIVKIDDETIEVQNTVANSDVTLTAVNGIVVLKLKANADGNATVKMPKNAGVYVLSANNKSFKIIRKH